jgi:hypothetical protein
MTMTKASREADVDAGRVEVILPGPLTMEYETVMTVVVTTATGVRLMTHPGLALAQGSLLADSLRATADDLIQMADKLPRARHSATPPACRVSSMPRPGVAS